jgi:hypothetical protein
MPGKPDTGSVLPPLTSLPESDQPKQRRHFASLKRAFTLGPEGLRKAAERAHQNRSEVLV